MLMALRDAGDRLGVLWKFHPNGARHLPRVAGHREGRDGLRRVPSGTGAEAKNTLYALQAPGSGGEGQVAWTADLGLGRRCPGARLPHGRDGTIYALGGGGQVTARRPGRELKWTAQAGPATYVSPPGLGRDRLHRQPGRQPLRHRPAGRRQEGAGAGPFDFGQHPVGRRRVTAPVPGPAGPGRRRQRPRRPSGRTARSTSAPTTATSTPSRRTASSSGSTRPSGSWPASWTTAALSEDNNTLYFGANKGVYALNAADGKLKWQSKIGGSIYASPTLDSRGHPLREDDHRAPAGHHRRQRAVGLRLRRRDALWGPPPSARTARS